MRALLIIFLLSFSGCQTLKKFNRTVSSLDSTVQKFSYVRSETTDQKEQVRDWQEFRIVGFDSLFRLPDLTIQNSPVPVIPQFIQGKDRIIYLPTERIIETKSRLLDSLVAENTRTLLTEKKKERTVERGPDERVFWLLLVLVLLSIATFFAQLARRKN